MKFINSIYPLNKCMMSESKNRIKKMTNKIFAILAACTAIPVKPNTPAIIATTRKISTQFNITYSFLKIKMKMVYLPISIKIPDSIAIIP